MKDNKVTWRDIEIANKLYKESLPCNCSELGKTKWICFKHGMIMADPESVKDIREMIRNEK